MIWLGEQKIQHQICLFYPLQNMNQRGASLGSLQTKQFDYCWLKIIVQAIIEEASNNELIKNPRIAILIRVFIFSEYQ